MGKGMTLQQFLGKLWQNRYLLLLFSLLGNLIAAAYLFAARPGYTATSEVLTGGYTVPVEVNLQGGSANAGPLGLELPAETLARLAQSPLISDEASQSGRLSEADAAGLAGTVTATAATSNSIIITATGATPQQAADRVQAIADAFLEFRRDSTRASLSAMKQQLSVGISTREDRIAALDRQLAAVGNNAIAAQGLLSERAELAKAQEQATESSLRIDGFLNSFHGGGVVTKKGSAETASMSPRPAQFLLMGVLGGLVVGATYVIARDRLSSRVRDSDTVSTIDGLEVLWADKASRGSFKAFAPDRIMSVLHNGHLQSPSLRLTVRAVNSIKLAREIAQGISEYYEKALRNTSGQGVSHDTENSGNQTDLAPRKAEFRPLKVETLGPRDHYATYPEQASPPGPTLLVVDTSRDHLEALNRAVEELRAHGASVVGAVVARGDAGAKEFMALLDAEAGASLRAAVAPQARAELE